MGFTPSHGNEIQSEYHVPREHAVAAIRALRSIADAIVPRLQVCELRTVAADRLWLSPQYERDTLGIHFTWKLEPIEDAVRAVEDALGGLDHRAHWGKVFLDPGEYPRRDDFAVLAARLDRRGVFRNDWFRRHFT
jgi:xylitol oxidase